MSLAELSPRDVPPIEVFDGFGQSSDLAASHARHGIDADTIVEAARP